MECPNCGSRNVGRAELCVQCGRRLPVSTGYLSPGTILRRRYEITAEPPRTGGMGTVYFALDRQAEGKPCVVKQAKTQVTSDAVLRKLQEEAQRMAAISRAIAGRMAEILEDFEDGGWFYIVQQRIYGKTLEEVFADRQPLAESEVVGWAVQCCRILRLIHQQEDHPVHRDISPDNLMLTPMGDVVLIDFGTLREFQRIVKGTAGMGKYGYTPPEQWAGNPLPQSDIFALGATVYFLLTGFLPLSDDSRSGKGPQRTDFAPVFPPIRDRNPKVSAGLERVLSRALELDVNKRYSSADEMTLDLEKQVEAQQKDVSQVVCPNPKCSTTNEAALVYCKRCLAPLHPGSQQCPRCQHSVPVNARFCPRDGTPLPVRTAA